MTQFILKKTFVYFNFFLEPSLGAIQDFVGCLLLSSVVCYKNLHAYFTGNFLPPHPIFDCFHFRSSKNHFRLIQ